MLKNRLFLLAAASAFALVSAPVSAAPSEQPVVISQDFSHDPAADGWAAFGDTNLFRFNPLNQNLEVTWDSSHSNSYFYHRLGTVLKKSDDFTLDFDLYLNDVMAGSTPDMPSALPLSIGLQDFASSTRADFAQSAPVNLAEFAFYPPFTSEGYTFFPTIMAPFITDAGDFNWGGCAYFGLPTQILMHITMSYSGIAHLAKISITANGVSIGTINDTPLQSGFGDYSVDTVAIKSYSEAGQASYPGSILAHGTVDNLSISFLQHPISELLVTSVSGVWQANFTGKADWSYVLQRSSDLTSWTDATTLLNGTNGNLTGAKACRPSPKLMKEGTVCAPNVYQTHQKKQHFPKKRPAQPPLHS